MLPAIPLFTLGGYILAEGGASRRLMRSFDALFGWLPGGLAIVTTLVLAFFTRSSYRFKQPLMRIYASTGPYVLIIAAVVLLVTYVPALTLWPLRLLD